jgi:myo-inositol-1(or 4)-monophosphatase
MSEATQQAVSPFRDQRQWETLCAGITELARQEIMPRYEHVLATVKADGSLLTEADTSMQRATRLFLEMHWPQFEFLGEESNPDARKAALRSPRGCWVLDPLDGTSNFASGIPVFTVSLALVVEGRVVVGLVYDPVRKELFAARQGLGAELNGSPLRAATVKRQVRECIGIVDFKRLDRALAIRLATEPPYASQRSIGSVALDWCWIAAGRGQLYCHGSQNIWDYAAGHLILAESGGASATFDGEPVFVPEVTKRSAIAATTPALFAEWREWLIR